MSKYYYNGVLLPEIPEEVLASYPYAVIGVNESTMQYQLLLSKSVWYSNGETATNDSSDSEPFLYAYAGDNAWKTGTPGNYGFSHSTRPLVWSSHDIPNGSATSTTVYFPMTCPMPESATGKCEYNGEEAPSIPVDVLAEYPYIYMITAKAFAAFSVRPYFYSTSSYPSTLKADGPGVTYNLVDGKWELNKSHSSIYIIISSILWANYNVPNGSEKATNVYFTGSSPVAINYLFGYLIRSGLTLYTVTDGALSALTETEITASLFQTYGVDDVPDGKLLLGLTDPEVLYWHDSTDDPPELTLTVTGSPPVPQIVITSTQDMSDPSILGIESATVDASDDVLFAISFDDGVTWKAYDGGKWVTLSTENSGMTKTTMENISLESWAEVAMSAMYKLRFVLMNAGSYVAAVRMNYIN